MNTKSLCWLTAGCMAAAALLAAANAPGALHPARSDAPLARKADNFSPYVTKDGGISRPTDYRDTFEYLGSYAVATKPDKPLDEMHVVYARPEDVRAYRRDGKFPDGATLVKEVTRVGSERLTTGQSHWATDVKLWFVMIAVVFVIFLSPCCIGQQGREGTIPRQQPVGRRVGLGPLHGKGARTQRGDRLLDRLQDLPRSGQEGRLGVHPRIPGAQEMTGVILIVGDSAHGPYREIPIRVEVLRVKDKGFIS